MKWHFLGKRTALCLKMTWISDYTLYFHTYFNDKKHVGAIAHLSELMKAVKEGGHQSSRLWATRMHILFSCLNTQHLSACPACPGNLQDSKRCGWLNWIKFYSFCFCFLPQKQGYVKHIWLMKLLVFSGVQLLRLEITYYILT